MAKLALIACSTLLAVAFIACGDDDDGGDTLSVDEYFARMSTIGEEVETKFDETEAAFDEAAAEVDDDDSDAMIRITSTLFENNIETLETARDRADDLTPPGEVASEHDEFIDALDGFIEQLEGILEDVEDADDVPSLLAAFDATESDDFVEASDRWDEACFGLQDAGEEAGAADADLRCGSDD